MTASRRGTPADAAEAPGKVLKTHAEWRTELTPEQFRVCREHGTERPFTGAYWDTKTPGTYVCSCCGQQLFSSATKYDSGTGWPSFWEPYRPEAIGTRTDRSFFMSRTEVHCSRCEAHLGHVFDDGPAPSGARFCINSVSLRLDPAAAAEPGDAASADGEREPSGRPE